MTEVLTLAQDSHETENCPKCGGPVVVRARAARPAALELIFALSFGAFVFWPAPLAPTVLWAWTALQAALGLAIIRLRLLARRRIYRCVRCDAPLR